MTGLLLLWLGGWEWCDQPSLLQCSRVGFGRACQEGEGWWCCCAESEFAGQRQSASECVLSGVVLVGIHVVCWLVGLVGCFRGCVKGSLVVVVGGHCSRKAWQTVCPSAWMGRATIPQLVMLCHCCDQQHSPLHVSVVSFRPRWFLCTTALQYCIFPPCACVCCEFARDRGRCAHLLWQCVCVRVLAPLLM